MAGLLAIVLAAPSGAAALHVKISPETVKDFERAAKVVESGYHKAVQSRQPLLLHGGEADLRRRVKSGAVVTKKLDDKNLQVKGGLSHYWAGAMFVPDGRIENYLKVLLDYERHKDYYGEVVRSKLISHDGDHYRSQLRLVKKKVLTAVLDVDFESDLTKVDGGPVYLRTIARRISQVEQAGTPDEKTLPVGHDSGFLWRQNSYWSLWKADGGVYVELVSFSLSRSIPTGLAWMIKPFITSIPKDTITHTLEATRAAAGNTN